MITVKNLYKTYQTPLRTGNFITDTFNRRYKSHTAVQGISFSIGENELVGFIGPNGAGKTTTLKMLAGILFPTSGTIDILGFTPFDKETAFLKQIGFVMGQKNQLIWDLPPTDTFSVNKEIYEIPEAEYRKRLGELTDMLNAATFLNQPVKTLSLGQRMKCELLSSLLHAPKILFLDEPTIGLDIFAQSSIRKFIKEYQQEYRATIILTSHYMQDVQQLADRVILLDAGSIIYDDTLEKLMQSQSQTKCVTITMTGTNPDLPAIVRKFEHEYMYPQLRVYVPKKRLAEVLGALVELDYLDVTVENEPIEDIIKKFYQQK
ncbi:MAG: ATP-binding cassette domain-containing protein [Patescibacteria group bacterium]|nr:ATP-binding cassette domain-containing protein [Patescibacteria group bacterium]